LIIIILQKEKKRANYKATRHRTENCTNKHEP
jgi:hypothetical protein